MGLVLAGESTDHIQSCLSDLQGKPWNPKRVVVEYVGEVQDGKYTKGAWKGDVPDGPWPPLVHPDGSPNKDGRLPFIMRATATVHFWSGDEGRSFPRALRTAGMPGGKEPDERSVCQSSGSGFQKPIRMW